MWQGITGNPEANRLQLNTTKKTQIKTTRSHCHLPNWQKGDCWMTLSVVGQRATQTSCGNAGGYGSWEGDTQGLLKLNMCTWLKPASCSVHTLGHLTHAWGACAMACVMRGYTRSFTGWGVKAMGRWGDKVAADNPAPWQHGAILKIIFWFFCWVGKKIQHEV